ncbi:hypothetical protein GCM10010965_21870 [Caldalkalibacillus thermarum]|uniref:competence pheromone ComX n=1 Tax=Caldalkalibacillus thermarum TaxID=296745 RepID=UPI001665B264|nr:competence pheromone ComX [Caldalkalibacillus thermarum]GGK28666.1 hypothetical protein GCM10010965_21870 [Caldalkalibacillus thermarum]
MHEIIQFLIQHPEILEKLKNGSTCLIGLNEEEIKAIIEVFSQEGTVISKYWT